MDINILVPNMGESVIEATVAHWLKAVGDPVTIGEPLVELETNKVNLDVSAEQNGTLKVIDKQEGEDVHVGDTLGMITVGELVPSPEGPAQPSLAQSVSSGVEITAGVQRNSSDSTTEKEKMTPIALRIAREHGLDPSRIPGSGVRGKVVKEDVEKFLAATQPVVSAQSKETTIKPVEETHTMQPATSQVRPVVSQPPSKMETSPSMVGMPVFASQAGREERVSMSRRRRTIAEKLVATQNSAAMLTTFNDVDMSAVMKIRQARKQQFKEKYGVNLGIVSFFVKAVILALKDFPHLNAEIQGDEMVIKHYYDIGIAIGDEEGLVVPILRDADRLSIVEIERSIQRFVQQTRDHSLSLADVMGGTFSITNGGVFGSLLSTPILNGPEVGILGLHRIEDRPVVMNGEVVVRPMMYLALSYDHRIVDGREAVQFLTRVKDAIQDPEILLLGL
jgi:2-oxoglutarate dehydrogenase E2 component (dihydrolipoamide succinyltransferase)